MPRIAVLGASNVALGLSRIVQLGSELLPENLDLVVAGGHGRSYGRGRSMCLGRSLPGLLNCGLWSSLERQPPSWALLADIGNDLAYGAQPKQVLTWVRECARRLLDTGARVGVVSLPRGALLRLSPQRLRLVSSLFFPFSPASGRSL